jgi:hypothetical protein
MIGYWRKRPAHTLKKWLLIHAMMVLTTAAAWGDTMAAPQSHNDGPARQVLLYFSTADGRLLTAEPFDLPAGIANQHAGRAIVEALAGGPRNPALSPTLPAGTAVEGFYLAPNNTAVVDLNSVASDNHPGGVMAETLSVFSVVNALVLNLSGIDQVKLLINGHETKTFAGHIDLGSPLKANLLLIK